MSLSFAVITVSDRSFQGVREDRSGPALVALIQNNGWQVNRTEIISDDFSLIKNTLERLSEISEIEIILTTGGTGFSPRDVTPEATISVINRLAPGLDEAMRSKSLLITPHAMLSRGVSGIRGGTLIINLPGNPNAAEENFKAIMPVLSHAVDLIRSKPDGEGGH